MSSMSFLISILIIVSCCFVQTWSQNEYKPSESALKSAPNDAPRELPKTAGPPIAGGGPYSKNLNQDGRDVLQHYDDYLFHNLEGLYARLSYAFKDATKRALSDCGCAVEGLALTTPSTSPGGATAAQKKSPASAPGNNDDPPV